MKNTIKYSLLYIEDEAYLRKAVVSYFEDEFSVIYEASNGIEALEIYKKEKPDIIITDIEMPQMNGLEFCEQIRQTDLTTPIIIMTAYSHTPYLLKATELNLIKYLIKPIDEELLEEALKVCFERITSKKPSVLDLGDSYLYDSFNHTLSKENQLIRLTSLQSKLVYILIKNQGRVVSYEQLENSLWYNGGMSMEALRCLVRDIRKVSHKKIIENISKMGYRVNINV
jgi:DNA-binding response OmpR family regulator